MRFVSIYYAIQQKQAKCKIIKKFLQCTKNFVIMLSSEEWEFFTIKLIIIYIFEKEYKND